MRVVWFLIIGLFIVALLVFSLTNHAKVQVTLWDSAYPEVPVWWLVWLSALAGCLVVGVPAVAEGAYIRLSNRRLRGEIDKLESQINYLRTQPPTGVRTEPGAAPQESPEAEDRPRKREEPLGPPSAPVYGAEDDDWPPDDDDIYSGGRAV